MKKIIIFSSAIELNTTLRAATFFTVFVFPSWSTDPLPSGWHRSRRAARRVHTLHRPAGDWR